MIATLLLPMCLIHSTSPDDAATAKFDAPKFGLSVDLPRDWRIAEREKDERIFVALIPQADADRPGVAACELAPAPESLEEYRTRIDGNAKRAGARGGKLLRNEVLRDPTNGDERLETEREFRPMPGTAWRELNIRVIRNRQLYNFVLNADEATYPRVLTRFTTAVAAAVFSAPNTGADLIEAAANRWAQREFKFAIDLPKDWKPALAPNEIALFYANGPAHGIWSDNVLVIAQVPRPLDLAAVKQSLPDALRREEPNCEVLSCTIVKQGNTEALETVVRTKRGPFSMTVLERRFKGERFDYEVKYTVESKRYDDLAPVLRKSLDGFAELPGDAPIALPGKPA